MANIINDALEEIAAATATACEHFGGDTQKAAQFCLGQCRQALFDSPTKRATADGQPAAPLATTTPGAPRLTKRPAEHRPGSASNKREKLGDPPLPTSAPVWRWARLASKARPRPKPTPTENTAA